MVGVTNTKVERRRMPGASFGVGGKDQVGEWDGSHDPKIKNVWKRQRSAQSSSEIFTEEQYGQSGIQKAKVWREEKERELYNQTKDNRVDQVARASMASGSRRLRSYRDKKRKKGQHHRANAAAYAAARVKVTAANGWIVSWVMFWYLTIQLPFALASTIGAGITAYIYSLVQQVKNSSGVVEFVVDRIITPFVDFQSAMLNAVKWWYGIDFDPIILFALPFLIIIALGGFQLLLCWFIYSLLGVKSLSGQFASAKVGTFTIALVGIAIPILNLFPLILIWTMVVWFKPR